MSYKVKKKIGPLVVGINSEYSAVSELPDLFDLADASFDENLDVNFNLLQVESKKFNYKGWQAGDFTIGEGRLKFSNTPEYEILVDYRGKHIEVYCFHKLNRNKKLAKKMPTLYKIYSSEFESIDLRIARGFIYYCLQPVLQMLLVTKGTTFVHGSSVVKNNGKGVLFTGWGGSGKTSTSSSLLLKNKSFFFLSDDIAIVDKNKKIYSNPAVSHIYPYNVQGVKELEDKVIGDKTVSNKLHWAIRKKYFGAKGVRRRIRPKDFYQIDDAIDVTSETNIFFVRNDEKDITIQVLEKNDIVSLSINVINYEIKGINELNNKINSIPRNVIENERKNHPLLSFFISKAGYFECLKSVYNDYYANSDCYLISVPKATKPLELLGFVEEEIKL